MRVAARTIVIVLSVITSGNLASGQSTNANAASLLERANAAMGCALVKNDTTIKVSGSLHAGSIPNPMPVTIESQGSTRWRSELSTPKERKTTIINSGRGQIQHSDGRITALAESNTSHQRPMHIPCLTNIGLPPDQIYAVLVRSETSGSDTLDVVDLELTARPKEKFAAARMKTTVWVSRTTGYLTKLQYVNVAEQDSNDAQAVEIDYANYRVIGGLAIPFHQITHSGQITLDLQLDSAQLNTQPADFNLR